MSMLEDEGSLKAKVAMGREAPAEMGIPAAL